MPLSPRPLFPRRAAAAMLVFVFSLMAPLAQASGGRVVRSGAQVRAQAGFGGPVLASPEERSVLEILERRNEWVRVKLANGREGWIHEVFVADDVTAEIAAASPAATVETARVEPAAAVEVASVADAGRATAAAPTAPPAPTPPPAPCPTAAEFNEMTRRLLADHGQVVQLQLEAEYGRAKLAEMNRSVEILHDQLEVMRSERDIAAASLEQVKAQQQAAIDAGVKSDLDSMRAEQRAELESQHAQAIAEIEARHQSIVEGFIAMVTLKHDDALARETAVIQDECDRRLIENNRKNAKELRIARKDSGYEADLEKEVRERLDMEILEAKTKWEAKQRGEMYDVERARREEGDRVRLECEGARLAAVNLAAEQGQAELREALGRERQEADLRCQVALSIVLEHAASGGDLAKVKSLAEGTATRRSHDAAKENPGTPDANAPVNEPSPPPTPVPRPVPYPNQQEAAQPNPGGTRP